MKQRKRRFIIAIDGPASSGKSTTAKLVAKKLGCIYIDSGSMYRCVALYLLENNISSEDGMALKKVLSNIKIEIRNEHRKSENIILLNGRDVSRQIRKSEITKISSIVATKVVVRQRMVELQRKIAESQSVVMDGRDIGTVVFPDADFKFFLTASLDERAKRRWREMINKKLDNIVIEKIREDLIWRDKTDSTRKISPLKMAKDATLIDTTHLTITEQVQKVLEFIKSKSLLKT